MPEPPLYSLSSRALERFSKEFGEETRRIHCFIAELDYRRESNEYRMY
jgi:hypothetical protein